MLIPTPHRQPSRGSGGPGQLARQTGGSVVGEHAVHGFGDVIEATARHRNQPWSVPIGRGQIEEDDRIDVRRIGGKRSDEPQRDALIESGAAVVL